jgi:hypothetical protein
MQIFETIKQEAFDGESFPVRTEGPNDYLVTVRIRSMALKLDKVNVYGDPEPHLDIQIDAKAVPKTKTK